MTKTFQYSNVVKKDLLTWEIATEQHLGKQVTLSSYCELKAMHLKEFYYDSITSENKSSHFMKNICYVIGLLKIDIADNISHLITLNYNLLFIEHS